MTDGAPAAATPADRARRAISLIDLTDLSDDRSGAGIADLCARADAHRTAAVCVWSEHVAQCAAALADTDVGIKDADRAVGSGRRASSTH